MSGDVQPRKRKDKRRKKDVSNVPAEYRAQKMRVVLEDLPGSEDVGSSTFSSDETIHVHKDTGTGGNICAKVVFFLLLGALAVMVGLILTEYRGSSDVDTPVAESRWVQMFDGLVDESLLKQEEHDEPAEQSNEHDEEHSEESEEHGDGEHDEHGEEEEEEEEEEEGVDSEEAQSPEQEEDEQISDEIEDGQEEEEEEEEEEEAEEMEELEVSEEELQGIPGVTESDEDDQGDDDSVEAEQDIDDVASEEAGGEEEEAASISTVAPVEGTSPKLNTETPGHTKETLSKDSQQIQQRKDRPIVVSLEGERESPSMQMKGESYPSLSGDKLSTSDPHAVHRDGENKVLDKNTTSTNVIQGIPVAYDKDAPEHSAESITSTSSIPAGKPSMSHAASTEKGSIPTEKQSAPHIPKEKPSASHILTKEPSAPHIPTGKPSASHIPVEEPGAPHIPTEKPSASHILTEEPSTPHIPTEKPSAPHILTEEPSAPHIPAEKPSASHISMEEPSVPHISTEELSAPYIPTEKPSAPHILTEEPSAPYIATEKPSAPHIPTEKPSAPYIATEKPSAPHIPTEKLSAPHIPTESPSAPHVPMEKLRAPQTPAEKPSAPHIPTEKPSAPQTPAEKRSAPHIPTEKPSAPQIPAEQSSAPHAPTEKLSSSNSEVPLTIIPKAASQSVHGSDLTEDKLGFSKVTEITHPEYSESIDVKPFVSQASSKEPVGGTKQDTHVYQQQNKAEESQKAQAPDSATQSAGKVPKEASVLDDKSELKLPETVDTASRTSASKQKKAESENSDEDEDDGDGDGDGDNDVGDDEAVEELGGEETEGEKEGGLAGEDGDGDGTEEEPSGATRAAVVTPEESGSEEEESEEEKVLPARRATESSGGQAYGKADITNKDDLKISKHLDRADAELDEKPEEALRAFLAILVANPVSPRARYGKARALDQLAEKKHSNSLLQEAIDAYENVLSLGASVPDKLFVEAAERCINRMRFKGQYHTAIHIHKKLIQRFSDDPAHPNQLAVTYLMINRLTDAKHILEDTLSRWPDNGFAQVHYGFILKTGDNNNEAAVDYLTWGIATRDPGTMDGRFFFHLGDALTRLGRHDEAGEVYELGVKEGLFLSKYQRSLYNIDRLRAQPWWTPEETTYSKYFKKLQDNWQHIREEGMAVLANKVFKDEAENLRDVGNWQQFELFARGRKIAANCEKAPFTCQLINEFPAARDCRRGQVKFSVMHAGTHVWPHCGPTNCRLRSHLGLIVPQGTYIRVAEETRTWEEGKLFIFDDSFEHEVWHNATTTRLVLIVDVWHPELTEAEKRSMPAI